MTDLDLKELFISGLEPNLQLVIRQLNKDRYKTEKIIIKAKEEEIKLNQVKASERERKNRNNFNSNNNNNNSNTSSLCSSCKVDQATPGKSMCTPCFKKSKENNNNNNNNINNNNNSNNKNKNNNSNNNNTKLCIGCNLNFPTPGKSKCQSCFINKVNNKNNSNSNNNNNNDNKSNNNKKQEIDFTQNKVKYITINNSSTNPLYWDNTKILDEKRCLYCTELMSKHSTPTCKENYPNYSAPEIRTLLSKSITPPTRTSMPTGTPQSPP